MSRLPFLVSQTPSNISYAGRTFALWITSLLERSRRLLPLAVVLSLILQFVPLGLPAPSRVVDQFLATTSTLGHRLSVLPAWVNPDSAAITKALSPVDQMVAGLGPQAAYAKETTPTSLMLTQVCEPDPANQGELITYTLYITNTGGVTASIYITNPLPANTTFESYNHPPESGGDANWYGNSDPNTDGYVRLFTGDFFDILGDSGLPPNNSAIRRFTVRVTVPITDQATITNSTILTANIPSELQHLCAVTVNAPRFAIDKVPSSPMVDAGGTLTCTLFVTNTGHLTATQSFTVTEQVPEGTNYVTSTAPSTYSDASRAITWTLDNDLGIGQSLTTTFVVTVTSPYTNGANIINTAYRAWSSEVVTIAEGSPVTVTVRSRPALSLTKSAYPEPVQAGALLTYALTLANLSSANGPAQNVVVTDTVPMGTWLQSHSEAVPGTTFSSSGTAPGSLITWTLPTTYSLPVGQSTQVTFTVQVYSPLFSGTLVTNPSYGATATNALAPTAGDPVTTTVNSSPRLTVTKSVTPSTVIAGHAVTYTIHIVNDGNETANGVSITDTLPVSFTFGSMVQGPGPNGSPTRVLTWTNQTVTGTVLPGGWMAPPGPLTLVFTATTHPDLLETSVHSNTVTATYSLGEISTGLTAPVTIVKPILSITKTDYPDPVEAGANLLYTITVRNEATLGGSIATGIVITDDLSDHFTTLVGYTAGAETDEDYVITWTVSALNPGEMRVFTVTAQVDSPLDNGLVITNTAWISSAEGVRNSDTETTTVHSTPDLYLTKIDEPDPVTAGETLLYTLTVVNAATSNGPATGVIVTDVLPVNTDFLTATTTGVTFEGPDANRVITWTLSSPLAWDSSVELTFTANVTAPLLNGTILTNTAWVTSDQGVGAAEAVGGNTDTVTTTVQSTPDLAIAKTDDPDPVIAGGVLTYTITVRNANSANGPATGIAITDALPIHTSFDNAVPPLFAGPSAGGVVTWTLTKLDPGDMVSFTLTLSVTRPLTDGTVLTNTVWVTSAEGVGNTDTETTTVRVPDLTISKWVTPTLARPGETITYVVVFTNTGGIAATGVRVTDTLPINLSSVMSQATGVTFVPGSTYAWYSPTVEAGGTGIITITAQVTTTPGWINPDGGTPLTNDVVITSTTPDDNPSDNQATAQTTIYAGLPATLTLTAVPTMTTVNGSATITVTATDSWGNPVMNQDNVTVTLNSSLVGSQITPNQVTLALGQATATITSTATGVADVTGAVGAAPTITDTTQVTFTAGTPATITLTIVPTTTPVGTSAAMTAIVADIYGNPVPNWVVTFTTVDDLGAGGLIAPAIDTTDAGGVATSVITSTALGVKTVEARASASVASTAPVTFTVGAPFSMTLTAVPDTVAVGVNATLRATVFDAYDNLVPGEVITFESVNLGGGGILPPTGTTDGVGEATSAISSTLTGVRTVTATASNGINATTPVTFIAGLPDVITLTIVPTTTPVGTSAQMTATVVDAYDNPVPNWVVTFTTVDDLGAGGLIAPATDPTNASGVATSVITSTVSGVKTVEARASASVASTAPVTFTAGAPFSMTLAAVPDTVAVGVNATLRATVFDAYDNPVAGEVITFESVNLGGGGILPPTDTTDGVGEATSAISSTLTGVRTVTATLSSNPNISATTPVTFVVGPPSVVTLTIVPTTTPVGTAAQMTATVVDAYDNPIAGWSVTFSTADDLGAGGSIVPATDATDASGVATSVITSTASGVKTVEARASASVAGTAQVTFTAGAPTNMVLTVVPDTVAVGDNAVLSAWTFDTYNNPISGEVITFESVNLGGGGIVPPTDTTDSAGEATSAISSTLLGVRIVTATLSSNPSINATALVTFVVGPPAAVTLMIVPATTPVGTSSQMTATLVDAYGNPVGGWPVMFSTADNLGAGTIAPVIDNTDASGIATSVITSTASGIKTVEARASASVTGTAMVTFTVGALHHFAIGPVSDPQTAGLPFTLVITAQDAFNNIVESFNGTIDMADSTGTLAPTSSGAFAGGLRSESVLITLAQENVTIVVTNTAGSETGISNVFDVLPNTPAMVTLQATPANIPLQGTAWLTATVTDAWSNRVADGTEVDFGTGFGLLNPITNTTSNGQATTQLTAECAERTGVVVTATAGTVFTTTTVNFVVPGAPQSITIAAFPTNIPVGSGTAILTATVYDCRPGPVPNQAVNLSTSLGSLSLGSGTTDAQGVVTATLSAGTAIGTAYITATANGLSDSTAVVIEPGPPATVTVTANPASIPANGSSTSTITVDVTDLYGNAVADGTGILLDYSPTALGILVPLNLTTTNGSGSAVFTADIVTGTVTITAMAGSAVGSTQLELTEGIQYVYMPLVVHNYALPPAYDLVVDTVTWSPSSLEAGQPYHVQVAIRNDGTMTVTDDFWVDLYLRPSTTPGINQTWNMLSLAGYGKAWLVREDIGPGETVTLLTSDPDDPQYPTNRYSYWPPPTFDTSHNPFFVLVDSWGESYGLVNEGSGEDNNLWGPANASELSSAEMEGMSRQPGAAAPSTGPRPPLR